MEIDLGYEKKTLEFFKGENYIQKIEDFCQINKVPLEAKNILK